MKAINYISDIYCITILLVFFTYHLMVYYGRNKYSHQRYNLYFALFSISLLGYLVNGTYMGQFIYNSNNILRNYLSVIEGIFVFFIGFFLAFYISDFFSFPEHIYKRLRNLIFTLAVILFFTLSEPVMGRIWYIHYLFTPIVISVGIIQLLMFFTILKHIITKNLYKSREKKAILAGLLLILFNLLIAKIMLTINTENLLARNNFLTGTAVLLFAYALSLRFNQEFKDLVILKNDLEKLVGERTSELTSANKAIMEASQRKMSFFINFAHETKTPLMLIRNYLDRYIFQKGIDPELLLIRKNFDKLYTDMVNYLDEERLSVGQLYNIEKKVVDISSITKDKIELFRLAAEIKNIHIIESIDENAIVFIDSQGFDKIANNLIDNAIKYNWEGGKVKITVKKTPGEVIFKVTDNGPGISKEQQEHIFEPFYQIHEKQNEEGFGVGLSVVKALTKELNGRLNFMSKENLGTTFELRFKSENIHSIVVGENCDIQSERVKNIKQSEFSNEKRTILLVEDNLSLLQFIQQELSCEFNVCVALNGKEALKLLNDHTFPDLVITDVMMDEMNGLDLFNYMNNHPRYSSIPLIFITAKSIKEERLKMLQKGASDYIFKPFTLDELKARITSVLQNRKKSKNEGIREAIGLLEQQLENETPIISKRAIPDIYKRCKELELTERQKDIVVLLVKGNSYKQIAEELNISDKTATRHVQNIFEKLGVHNKVELINLVNN